MAIKGKAQPTPEDYEKLGRSIESALIDDYINWLGNTKRQLWQSFLRGIVVGFGTVLGATVLVAVLVWILHLLGGVTSGSWISDFLTNTSDTIGK